MNKDEAREAAIKKLQEENYDVHASDYYNAGQEVGIRIGFDAGAASVDRRAIVEEAFNMVKLIAGQRIEDDLVKQGKTTNRPYFHEAMDAVLAEIGGDDEQNG